MNTPFFLAESLFVFNFLFYCNGCFSLFAFGCVLFSKLDYCVLGFSFDFFEFQVVLIKHKKGSRKNHLSNFNLSLI